MEEQNTQPAPSLMNHAIKNGVILGVIAIVVTILGYVIDLSLLVTLKFLGFIIVIDLGYVIYAGINYRAGGYLSYGKAFQHGFVVLAVAAAVSTLFNVLLYHVIDPEMPQKMADAAITNMEEMMANFGAPQETIDQQVAEQRVKMADQFSIFGLVKSYFMILIWCAIIALITSLFVRKNKPVEL